MGANPRTECSYTDSLTGLVCLIVYRTAPLGWCFCSLAERPKKLVYELERTTPGRGAKPNTWHQMEKSNSMRRSRLCSRTLGVCLRKFRMRHSLVRAERCWPLRVVVEWRVRHSPGRCRAARLCEICPRRLLVIAQQTEGPARLVHFKIDVLQLFVSFNLQNYWITGLELTDCCPQLLDGVHGSRIQRTDDVAGLQLGL